MMIVFCFCDFYGAAQRFYEIDGFVDVVGDFREMDLSPVRREGGENDFSVNKGFGGREEQVPLPRPSPKCEEHMFFLFLFDAYVSFVLPLKVRN